MMSAAYIASESRRAARIAAAHGDKPVIWEEGDAESFHRFPFPFIGNWRPRGYTLVDTLFCDSSGLGAEDEPALSVRQLLARLRPGYAYAVIEAGQFQVHLGEFRPPYAARSATSASRSQS
jgi:hypothetical protein